MLSVLLYAATSIFVIYIILDLTWRFWIRRYSFLQSSPTVPWLGTAPYIGSKSRDIYNTFTNFSTKYNHLYVVWASYHPLIYMGCVEWLEAILKSKTEITKSYAYKFAAPWLGNSLLTSTGGKWKKRRNDLTGAFHFAILNDFSEIFEKSVKRLVKKLENGEKVVEVQVIVSLAMLDVICESSMGVKIDALEKGETEYSTALHQVKMGIMQRALNPLAWSNFIYPFTTAGKSFYKNLKIVQNFTTDVINGNIALRKNPIKEINKDEANQSYMKRKRVFLDTLLDLYDKGEIDVDGIRDEVNTFMLAGHDTTSAAVSFSLYEIGRHPDIQKKLHNEIDSISSTQCSLMDKIRLLKYMENVIKENLRLNPPVGAVSRMLQEDTVIGNNVVPAGTVTVADIRSVHRNEKYWNEPSVFNPDRFQSEDFLKRNPYCFIPFSAGPRNCIGQKFAMLEIKVFLYCILSKFQVRSIQTPDDMEIISPLTRSSENGIHIEFLPRNM